MARIAADDAERSHADVALGSDALRASLRASALADGCAHAQAFASVFETRYAQSAAA